MGDDLDQEQEGALNKHLRIGSNDPLKTSYHPTYLMYHLFRAGKMRQK
jgi:hypothetical protein